MRGVNSSCTGGSCTHHFCAPCYLRWCASSSFDCPKCRAPVTTLCLDAEFDTLCDAGRATAGAAARARAQELLPFTISMQIEPGKHAGITLSNVAEGPGVRVDAVRRRDAAYKAGMREGDVLIWLNGAPCRTHKEVVELIEKAKGNSAAPRLNFVLLPRPPGSPPIEPRRSSSTRGAERAQAESGGGGEGGGGGGGESGGGESGGERGGSAEAAADTAGRDAALPSLQALGDGRFVTRLLGVPSYAETAPGLLEYTLRFADADGEWAVARRYSKWRALLEKLQEFWPRVLLEPTPLAFPPKVYPSFVVKASSSVAAERAQMLGRFVRGVLERARRDPDSGLAEWVQFWLRAETRRAAAEAAAQGAAEAAAEATAEATASEAVQPVGTPQVVDAQAMAETQSAQPHHAVVDLTDEAAGTPAQEDVG